MHLKACAAAALLAAFPGCNRDPGNPNGKLGVLFFDELANPVAVGLSEDVLMPKHVVLGGGPKSFDRSKTFDYDFTGTTLEATGANGIAILGTELTDAGWTVRIRCDAPMNTPSELHVRILAGTEVRYEDGWDLVCHGPTQLRIVSPAAPTRVAVGGAIALEHELVLTDGRSVYGRGVVIPDPSSPLVYETPSGDLANTAIWLLAVHAGSGAILQAGPATAQIPIEVLDANAWTVRVAAARVDAATVSYTVNPIDAAGAALGGLYGCAIQANVGGTSTTASTCQGTLAVGAGTGTLCATVLGHTGCADVAP